MAFDLDEEELKATRKMNKADRNEIEVNEYVRTNKGNIGKVVEIRLGLNKDTELYQTIYILDNGLWTILDYIVKHSKQLIDLIEFGDIVNGIKVIYKGLGKNNNVASFDNGHDEVKLKDIKTILTKEIYMANCYKVGGENEQ
jgi:hypothetical protein